MGAVTLICTFDLFLKVIFDTRKNKGRNTTVIKGKIPTVNQDG